MLSGIYSITNKVNGKSYIGSAKSISDRWNRHVHLLRRGKHHNKHLQSSWDKYGESSFTFDTLENDIPSEQLESVEQCYLDVVKLMPWRYYNMSYDAYNRDTKHSEETKQKISLKTKEAMANLPASTKKTMRDAWAGKKHSAETIQAYSLVRSGKNNPMFGKKHSVETRQLMSQNRWGKYAV